MKGTWVKHPSGPLNVIFIHGILSDGDSCWRHSNSTYWPDLLAKERRLSSAGIYVFEYKTSIFSGTYRLGDVVDALRHHLRLDGVLNSKQFVFACHSMGGIVARRFLVQSQVDLIDSKKDIGLFLIASPSLGARYANWLSPLAHVLRHTQADALRFTQDNAWLMDLDRDFLNLKESGRLSMRGKELVEDQFVVLRRLLWQQVVEPFSGARYFGDAFKVANSDHFSIVKVPNADAIQHKLLVEFICEFGGALAEQPAAPREDGVCQIRFADPLIADLVACQVATDRIASSDCAIEIAWPAQSVSYSAQLQELTSQAADHLNPASVFHGQDPEEIAEFVSSARWVLKDSAKITAGAADRAKKLVHGMLPYWTQALDNIIAEALRNFLMLCNYEITSRTLNLFRYRWLYQKYFPTALEEWFTVNSSKDAYKRLFGIDEEICSAKVFEFSGRPLEGVYFWGPRKDVLASAARGPGDPVRGRWVERYLIPQNELRLLHADSDETFKYDEEVRMIKVVDSRGTEIA